MTDCDHSNATGVRTGDYHIVDGTTYRAEKYRCDDCGETFYEVYERVSVDAEASNGRGAVHRHIDGWTDTE